MSLGRNLKILYHLLLSPMAADRLQTVAIDKKMRENDKPSDHVPIRIDLH